MARPAQLAATSSGQAVDPLSEDPDLGLRVDLPEPGGVWSLVAGAGALWALRQRRGGRSSPAARPDERR